MKKIIFKGFPLFLLLVFSAAPLNAAGEITALVHKGGSIISATEDGFIIIWNAGQRTVSSRFQLTANIIQSLISHPEKNEICIIESGGINNYRITAWNYESKQKLFSVFSSAPVGYINYSAGGKFIIAGGLNGETLSLLDSTTGQIVSTARIPVGNVSFAMTGRAEKNILVYISELSNIAVLNDSSLRSGYSGMILYYDIDSREVTESYQVPGNLSKPVIFGNNRFLAGINSDGLMLIDAAFGDVYDSISNMDRSTLLFAVEDGFYSLRQRGTTATLNRYTVDRNARLVSSQQLSLSLGASVTINAIAYNGSLAFASSQGNVLFLDRQNRIIAGQNQSQTRITEIAAGEQNIAFLTDNGSLCFIPADYSLIQRSAQFTLSQKRGYTRITSVPNNGEDRFILWQTNDTRNAPQLLEANRQTSIKELAFLFGRFPLLSISVLNNRLLTLDTGGNIAIRNIESLFSSASPTTPEFSFSSIGAVDSSLINSDYLVVSRSAINNNSPFLFVNIRTSETVPVSYPAQAGLTVFSGAQGVYAEAVERDNNGLITTVISLPPVASTGARASSAVRIFEYRGEAVNLSIAESEGNLAIACDGEGAFIVADNNIKVMERTNGLPVKLLGNEKFFISLDSEGNIAWHDNKTGALLAVFSLNGNRWTLSTDREITGTIRN